MRTIWFLVVFVSLVLLAAPAVNAQALDACDLNANNQHDVGDWQLAIDMYLGIIPCTANVNGANRCDIVTVERVKDAYLGYGCLTSPPHSVSLNWTASTSSNVTGYNVYRGIQSGGPYTKINAALVAGTSYEDTAVQAGAVYYYVATSVDASNSESANSNQAIAVVPRP